MSFNVTQVAWSSSVVSYSSVRQNADHVAALSTHPTNQLGYGLGQLARGVFDKLLSVWNKVSTQEPTEAQMAKIREDAIYRSRLHGCVKRLEPLLASLRKNPYHQDIYARIAKVANDCASFLKPSDDMNLRREQQSILEPIIARLPEISDPHIHQQLSQLLPLFYQSEKRYLQQGFPSSFDLTTLNGVNGLSITGLGSKDTSGYCVTNAGDINKDGIADLAIGAYGASPDSTFQGGSVYVIFGQVGPWPTAFNLTTLNGTNGFTVNGHSNDDEIGWSVSGLGDINNDGVDDLAFLGTASFTPTYILFGHAGVWQAEFDTSILNGGNGFSVSVVTNWYVSTVSSAGDVNHDGIPDIVFEAVDDITYGGSAYVLFGQPGTWPATLSLSSINGTNGFAVNNLNVDAVGVDGVSAGEYDGSGTPFRGVGDINHDGIDDLALGSYSGPGTVYVIFGQAGPWPSSYNVSTLDGIKGFTVNALAANTALGWAVAGAGDINHDGIDDLVLGAFAASEAYIVFGHVGPWPNPFNLANLNGTNGFTVNGATQLGWSFSGPGDVNADGIDDLMLGADGASYFQGATYILFGHAGAWPTSFSVTSLNGANGFAIDGILNYGFFGWSVSGAGDLNADNIADMVMSAPWQNGFSNGITYVIFGKNTSIPTPTPISSPFASSQGQIPTLSFGSSSQPPSKTALSPSNYPTSISSSSTAYSPFSISRSTQIPLVPSPQAQNTITKPITLNPTLVPSPPQTIESSPLSQNLIIGLSAGAGGLVLLLGGLITLVACLRRRKKTSSSVDTPPQPSRRRDEELGLRKATTEPTNSLFILSKDLKIEKKIAEGGFGDVYKGLWQNEDVAIKQLKANLSQEAEKKLFDEVQVMASLRSPYVVSFFGVTKEKPYQIVMQFMEGGSLRDFLKQCTAEEVPWNLRFQIGHDISQGIKYLHDRQIVHADLKSPNVLLDTKRRAKLADFGLATIKTDSLGQYYENTSQVKGSLLWMAPELFDKSRHTFATDIYSLGVILWEIASHCLPFEEKKWGVGKLIAQVTQGEREKFPKGTPRKYELVAKQCWDGEPEKRPTAEEAAQVLSKLRGEKKNDNLEENVDKPAYLTGTGDLKSEKKDKPSYIDNDATKFGV